MKRKFLNTLVAMGVLAALWGGLALHDWRKGHAKPKTESKSEEKVLSLDSNHIQSFTLKPRSGDPVGCRREGGSWTIVEPRKLPADQSGVSAFLSSLTGAAVDRVVEERPSNLKDFGLDPPGVTVEVSTDAKPQQFKLLLGDETPTGDGVYAQLGGNPRVVTLATYLKSSLQKNLFDLRDKRAVTLDVDRLQRIEVEAKGKHWTLAKNPEGVWDLVLPPPVRADRFGVDGILSQLRSASMQAVAAEEKKNASKYGFDSPALTVKLTAPTGSQKLVLGKKDGERYDAMNYALDPIFTLNADFFTQFQKDPADLRDKDLFAFSSFEVKRVEVETPKGRRVFEQQKDKWKQTVPSAKDENSEKMDNLLNSLRELRATSFPKGRDLASFGLTKPAYKFQVQFGEKNQTEVAEAAKVGERVYARRSNDPLPCELSKTALDSVEKALGEL